MGRLTYQEQFERVGGPPRQAFKEEGDETPEKLRE